MPSSPYKCCVWLSQTVYQHIIGLVEELTQKQNLFLVIRVRSGFSWLRSDLVIKEVSCLLFFFPLVATSFISNY